MKETKNLKRLLTKKSNSSGITPETRVQIKRVIEALLFACSDPLSFEKIREITDMVQPIPTKMLDAILQNLQDEYHEQQRSFLLEKTTEGYVLRTCEQYTPFLEMLGKNKRSEKLSQAAAEVLAIIAYRQPITRSQIDNIRGVDSSGTLANLLERQLIQHVGRQGGPGRPSTYGITKEFLSHFGLQDIKEMSKK